MKKLDSRSRVRRRSIGRKKRSGMPKTGNNNAALLRRLDDLCEQFELVLPEVTARVAALEHLLREKELVSRADLISARAFVRLQEA